MLSFSKVLKLLTVFNRVKKAVDMKDFEDVKRYVDRMFKDAPEDVRNKIYQAIEIAKKYAESGKNVDLFDLAEDMMLALGLSEKEAEEASKVLVAIAEEEAKKISESLGSE